MASRKNIIEQIIKLLALSANNPNKNEALAAEVKAIELMNKHNIKRSEVGLPPLKHQKLHDFPNEPVDFIKDIDAFNIATSNFAINLKQVGESMKNIRF